MHDIALEWGSDLLASANGDLLLTTGTTRANRRIVRRLLTNQGDYIWNRSYGGGLASAVGQPLQPAQIEAVIRTQLRLEDAVSTAALPTVELQSPNPSDGIFAVKINYVEAGSGKSGAVVVSPS